MRVATLGLSPTAIPPALTLHLVSWTSRIEVFHFSFMSLFSCLTCAATHCAGFPQPSPQLTEQPPHSFTAAHGAPTHFIDAAHGALNAVVEFSPGACKIAGARWESCPRLSGPGVVVFRCRPDFVWLPANSVAPVLIWRRHACGDVLRRGCSSMGCWGHVGGLGNAFC